MKRLLSTSLGLICAGFIVLAASKTATSAAATDYTLRLVSGQRAVTPEASADFLNELKQSSTAERGVVVQFYDLPNEWDRARLDALGIHLYQYIPDRAYIASVPRTLSASDLSAAGIRWIGALSVQDKIAEVLDRMGTPDWSRDSNGVGQFTIKVFGQISPEDAAQWLATEYGATIDGTSRLANAVSVRLPADNWYDIANDDRVQWIEPYMIRRVANNSARDNTKAEVVQAAPYSLDGTNVMVGEWDGGKADLTHPDFAGRIYAGDGSGAIAHATHVAGSVMGSGAQSGGTYRGMAPNGELVSYKWFTSVSSLEDDYTAAISNFDIDISTNSWIVGYAPSSPENCEMFLGNYFTECETLDDVIRGSLGKTLTIAWAAGNERSGGPDYCGSLGFTYGTVPPYGTSKNVITIGAINSDNSSMTSFSSWGPVDDGRLKPELVAPGCQASADYGVTSTRIGGGYTTYCGTSMATPISAGCFALFLQRYKEMHPGETPLGSTVKAAFCNSADDLGNKGPDFRYGFGRLNVQRAVDIAQADAFFEDEITDGDTLTWTFAIPTGFDTIQFTLAWDDPGAAENADPTLINDLDLRVQTQMPFGETFQPWVLNPAFPDGYATTGEDQTNNIEQVRSVTGLFANGTWTLLVIGHNVPEGPQKFSVAFTPGLTMTPGQQPYAADLIAAGDIAVTPGNQDVSFVVHNAGREDDVYDLTVTSARGWTITPNPTTVAVAGRDDLLQNFALDIPLGTSIGVHDTVACTLVSQTDPLITDIDSVDVDVTAGYGAELVALADTAGVPGRHVSLDVLLRNTGTQADDFDWTVTDLEGWTITPNAGSVSLPLAGETGITLDVAIGASTTPGTVNPVGILAVSQGDPAETGSSTTQVEVIGFPPEAEPLIPIDGLPVATDMPELIWHDGAHATVPPGFAIFHYSLEVADDTDLTVGMVRYDAIPDTAYTLPVSLVDGAHFWRVITYNDAGDSSGFGPSARFDVDTQSPDAPVLLSPPDHSFGSDVTPTFTWSPVTSKVLAKVAATDMTYLWELSEDSLFGTLLDSTTTTGLSHTIGAGSALDPCSTVVFWRVTATDVAGNVSAPATPARHTLFIRGDMDGDCVIDALDLNSLIDFLFYGGPSIPPERAELNCLPGTDALDLSYLIDLLFFNGPDPCSPDS